MLSALLFCTSTAAALYVLKKPTNDIEFGMIVMLNAASAVLAFAMAFNEGSYGLPVYSFI